MGELEARQGQEGEAARREQRAVRSFAVCAFVRRGPPQVRYPWLVIFSVSAPTAHKA